MLLSTRDLRDIFSNNQSEGRQFIDFRVRDRTQLMMRIASANIERSTGGHKTGMVTACRDLYECIFNSLAYQFRRVKVFQCTRSQLSIFAESPCINSPLIREHKSMI